MIFESIFDELVTNDTATNSGFANVMMMLAAVPDLNSGDRAAVATAAVERALMSSSRTASPPTQDRELLAMVGTMVQKMDAAFGGIVSRMDRIASNQELLSAQLVSHREDELENQILNGVEILV